MEVPAKKPSKEQPPWTAPTGGDDKGLKVLNSLASKSKVAFIPASGNRVTWYICGPTVYDSSHFGHARNYVTFDVVRRILSDYFNYDVFSVMNITDVDDKIILRARRNYLLQHYEQAHTTLTPEVFQDTITAYKNYKEKLAIPELLAQVEAVKKEFEGSPQLAATKLYDIGPTRDVLAELVDSRQGHEVTDESIFRKHAAKYENEFLEDMKNLGVRMPDVMTRVTEYVPEVIAFVQKIIANEFAYESNGSVYFNTAAFSAAGYHYAKLQPWSVGNAALMSEGEGSLSSGASEKRSANDFALWKKSKPGEPQWESPWGKGRPGWHIECSAMAGDILGTSMDIHSGGSDLRFPHHDNEIAQSEACFMCKQWVNYFLHSGHLHIDGLKMSKSKKNFVTIRQVLESGVTARQIRLYFLTQSWCDVMDFDRQTGLVELKNKEKSLLRFFEETNQFTNPSVNLEGVQSWTDKEKQLHSSFMDKQAAVHSALQDNFNTPEAVGVLFKITSDVNAYLDFVSKTSHAGGVRALLVAKIVRYVARIFGIFGVEFPEFGFGAGAAAPAVSAASSDRDALVDVVVNLRKQVREAMKGKPNPEILALMDQLRDEIMPEFGVRITDEGKVPWTPVSASALKAEIAENKRIAAQKIREKKQKRLEQLNRDIPGWEAKAMPPQELFHTPEFSAWNEQGLPTHLGDGSELPASKKKALEKKLSTHTANYKKYLTQLEKDAEFLNKLKEEAATLTAELQANK
eukprot:TRINITY_DN4470_c0_g1_i2.p1 TRINITY_DN4470_c0_g1~~TRINITY_DN4470_c0_g1_i2.p1  ORF type:complete len:744 (+),score=147.00 TRINITY_DN4470_c0_g1_i2:33-2264(+)